MYTIYTDEQVFENGNANIACNLLHQQLIAAFDEATIANNFFLTGMPARIIQGAPKVPATVISFGTNNDAVFGFCSKSLGKLIGASGTVLFTDQAQIVYSENIFIEVWLLPTPGALVTTNGIVMQNQSNIPPYII